MPRKKKEKKEGCEHLQGVFYVAFSFIPLNWFSVANH